jgi:hypothetical protein
MRSSKGGICFQCSQCSSQRFQALMLARMMQGITTLLWGISLDGGLGVVGMGRMDVVVVVGRAY